MKVRWIESCEEVSGQCEMPLSHMTPGAVGYKGWRFRALPAKGLDPQFCSLQRRVEIDGKQYCTKHAGGILIERLAGKQPARNYEPRGPYES